MSGHALDIIDSYDVSQSVQTVKSPKHVTIKLSLTEEKMKGRADDMKNNNGNCCHLLGSSYVVDTAQRALHI